MEAEDLKQCLSPTAARVFSWSLTAMPEAWTRAKDYVALEREIVREWEANGSNLPSTPEYPRWWHRDQLLELIDAELQSRCKAANAVV